MSHTPLVPLIYDRIGKTGEEPSQEACKNEQGEDTHHEENANRGDGKRARDVSAREIRGLRVDGLPYYASSVGYGGRQGRLVGERAVDGGAGQECQVIGGHHLDTARKVASERDTVAIDRYRPTGPTGKGSVRRGDEHTPLHACALSEREAKRGNISRHRFLNNDSAC